MEDLRWRVVRNDTQKSLKDMNLNELDAGYEKGKVTPQEAFLAWLEVEAKRARRDYIECKLSESAKYNAIMITLERVLDKYKEINP